MTSVLKYPPMWLQSKFESSDCDSSHDGTCDIGELGCVVSDWVYM